MSTFDVEFLDGPLAGTRAAVEHPGEVPPGRLDRADPNQLVTNRRGRMGPVNVEYDLDRYDEQARRWQYRRSSS